MDTALISSAVALLIALLLARYVGQKFIWKAA